MQPGAAVESREALSDFDSVQLIWYDDLAGIVRIDVAGGSAAPGRVSPRSRCGLARILARPSVRFSRKDELTREAAFAVLSRTSFVKQRRPCRGFKKSKTGTWSALRRERCRLLETYYFTVTNIRHRMTCGGSG